MEGEGDQIKSKQASKRDRTLINQFLIQKVNLENQNSAIFNFD